MPKVLQEQSRQNRHQVVEVASALFRERGLHGVGVAEIMAAAGLTHGGFYGHFTSKDALAVEAFDAALGEEHRGKLDALIANYLSLGHINAPAKGCPLAALANDVAREPPGSPIRSRSGRGRASRRTTSRPDPANVERAPEAEIAGEPRDPGRRGRAGQGRRRCVPGAGIGRGRQGIRPGQRRRRSWMTVRNSQWTETGFPRASRMYPRRPGKHPHNRMEKADA